jgi:predicted O-methyltransferase YrrM
LPYIRDLVYQIERQGAFPAGHYYSPIPEKNEVLAYIKLKGFQKNELPGINLHSEGQLSLLNQYIQFYKDIPFPETKNSECRYYYENDFFSYSDAIFLYSFLRLHKPKRIIEVGSGFSSAAILDTVDRVYSMRPVITFIDPFPSRLRALLKENDEKEIGIIEKNIQDVPGKVFSSLKSGDLLFIDSSHVVKCGSDLQVLLFDILPLLPDGVFVHFHDIFYPFEYPSSWLKEGRYWNENYFLHAFLSDNSRWQIYFFNTYVAFAYNELIEQNMMLCTRDAGGSLYIQKRKTT